MKDNRLVLASASPRRAFLLAQMHIPYRVCPQHINEETFTCGSKTASELAVELSYAKAIAACNKGCKGWGVLGADTIVADGDVVLGKPSSREEAREFLLRLSGRTHLVHTGITIIPYGGSPLKETCTTQVTFTNLEKKTIERLLSLNEWKDAAGGYRIQGFGGVLVKSITGSHYNVMGLPIHLIYGILQALEYPF